MKVKLPKESRSYCRLSKESRFDGRYFDCVELAQKPLPADFDWRWHRSQMRGWAQHWRNSRVHAGNLNNPPEEMAETAISLAVYYRDRAAELKEATR